jgi:hypothetical protein
LLELKDWIENTKLPDKPWLVLGKGPTFSQRSQINLAQYNTFGLNHVVRQERVQVAHIIDIEVVEPCGESILTNCDWLLMPRSPHVNCLGSQYMNLEDWLSCIPTLAEAERRGKLVTYSFAHEPVLDDPWTIDARFFSSEVALGVLARMGLKTVDFLGIDGGRNYSNAFEDLKGNTLLVNGQPSFDLQFERLDELSKRYGITYKPLIKPSAADLTSATTCSTKVEAILPNEPAPLLTVAAKIQKMETEIRKLNNELTQANELLYFVTKELSVCSQRLAWSQDEIDEYRERVLDLERQMHSLYRSTTWKIGRAVTKPVETIGRQFSSE